MLNNIVTSIYQTIIEKVGIVPKFWQINAIIDIIYNKKNIVILANIGSDKSLFY